MCDYSMEKAIDKSADLHCGYILILLCGTLAGILSLLCHSLRRWRLLYCRTDTSIEEWGASSSFLLCSLPSLLVLIFFLFLHSSVIRRSFFASLLYIYLRNPFENSCFPHSCSPVFFQIYVPSSRTNASLSFTCSSPPRTSSTSSSLYVFPPPLMFRTFFRWSQRSSISLLLFLTIWLFGSLAGWQLLVWRWVLSTLATPATTWKPKKWIHCFLLITKQHTRKQRQKLQAKENTHVYNLFPLQFTWWLREWP